MPVVSHVTCPVCGDFCDDIEVTVKNNVITDVKYACAVGAARFLGYSNHRQTKPLMRKNGELVECSLNEAIQRSAEILADASYPILFGWSSTSCEATRVGLELAEEIGAVIDNTSTICHGSFNPQYPRHRHFFLHTGAAATQSRSCLLLGKQPLERPPTPHRKIYNVYRRPLPRKCMEEVCCSYRRHPD